jgi:LmbE family N-acetylglucosaminyl deacetylase
MHSDTTSARPSDPAADLTAGADTAMTTPTCATATAISTSARRRNPQAHSVADGPPRIEGAGTPESAWCAWPGLAGVPRLSLDTWLPLGARLVVVAPHPDDEILAAGGLISRHAAGGGDCLVVAVTDGEASHPGASGWTPVELARTRRAESTEGLRALGLRRAEMARLGLPDGDVVAHRTQLTAGLALVLRPSDVVVTTWRADGHPDHEAVGEATAGVCDHLGCRLVEAPVWMWHWAAPGDARVPWERLAAFDLDDASVDHKRQALAAHASQLTPRDAPDTTPVLGGAIVERAARRTEFFFV